MFKTPTARRGIVTKWICDSCRSRQEARRRPLAGSLQARNASNVSRRAQLPDFPARTRFAPSPTGDVHLGSIRTAAFNYLLAKRTGGQFLLRLEDTDRKRTIPGAEEKLYDDLRWAGLHWDEGPSVGGQYGPYRQSERLEIYQKHIARLLETGRAYRCFCSPERLDELNRRRHEKGLNLGYDRKCADIHSHESDERAHKGAAHVVRFRAPPEWPKYNDLVYGKTGHGAEKAKKLLMDEPVWEDAILIKSDGFPTYHWANVCDDFEMKITHVVRGSEWMSSTPLHLALYQSMDWTLPLYAHVPLLVDTNGQKLSKRNSDTNIFSYRHAGVFPETLVNFAALLGWSHQQKHDVMNLRELEALFDLKITKGNTIVSFDKLRFLQDQHAKRHVHIGGDSLEQLIRDVAVATLSRYGAAQVSAFIGKRQLRDVIASMLQVDSFRYWSPEEFVEHFSIFLDETFKREPLSEDPTMGKKLRVAAATLTFVPKELWTEQNHRSNLVLLEEAEGPGNKDWKKSLYHYLRWALVGGASGPTIPKVMEILGKDISVERLQSAALEIRDLETMATRPKVILSSQSLSSTRFEDLKENAAVLG